MADLDGYDERYAAKLWSLVPEVYRTEDGDVLDQPGPLQELLARIGSQVAVVRRSIDRLWEDQSIETCDSWVIPYIAALLDTNLVPAMDARGQRLDVANTIDYRRRKGTVGLLEQLAADVTGWDARIVEFFRRLGRNRHSLDPAFGWPADSDDPVAARQLQWAEGLVGLTSSTPLGGTADLRNALGAANAYTAYDEYSHRVDVRRGVGRVGWYGIPKLGVFVWRHASIGVDRATPVPVAGCPDHYSFDPTGRQISLWAAAQRSSGSYGEAWVSPQEWQLPGPLSQLLLDSAVAQLWPESLHVARLDTADPLAPGVVGVWPEVGRFSVAAGTGDVEVGYHYGLFALVGAGPYDRRVLGQASPVDPAPVSTVAGGSAVDLKAALAGLGAQGTIVVSDALTNTAVADVGSPADPIVDMALRAADQGRAVVRLGVADGPWVFQGTPQGQDPVACLRLEGVLLSGQDLVLRGGFAQVTLSCCTVDPGSVGDVLTPPALWASSVDGRDLSASRVWVEQGSVRQMIVERCLLGPIRTRIGGTVERLSCADSVVQALPSGSGALLGAGEVMDADDLVRQLHHRRDPLSDWLAGQLAPATQAAVDAHGDGAPVSAALLQSIVDDLNAVIAGPSIWDPARFAGRFVALTTLALLDPAPTGEDLVRLNRLLLAAAYPVALEDAALAFSEGSVELARCTILGPARVHRLECSESILDDVVVVEDTQDGCVRFSAWASESLLPRKYESVEVAPRGPLFESRRFGEAGYAVLLEGVDQAILGGALDATISAGAQDGSEMGAFSAARAPLKQRSLLIKFAEFMPVGLSPVVIRVPGPDGEGEKERARPWPPT